MRMALFIAWLLLPLGFAAWHYGPGQKEIKVDEAADALAQAEKKIQSEDFAGACELYQEALKTLPEDKVSQRRAIQLALNKSQMRDGKLPEASQDLKNLVEEISADQSADTALLDETRSALAQSQYYMTWLMRLEGIAQDEWEPEVDSARQNYRLLAEQAEARGDQAAAKSYQEDLESTIRLARMNLDELQSISLPKQCCGCCSGKCNNPGKKPGKQAKQRAKDSRGASSGPPPDGSGH